MEATFIMHQTAVFNALVLVTVAQDLVLFVRAVSIRQLEELDLFIFTIIHALLFVLISILRTQATFALPAQIHA